MNFIHKVKSTFHLQPNKISPEAGVASQWTSQKVINDSAGYTLQAQPWLEHIVGSVIGGIQTQIAARFVNCQHVLRTFSTQKAVKQYLPYADFRGERSFQIRTTLAQTKLLTAFFKSLIFTFFFWTQGKTTRLSRKKQHGNN